MSQSNLHTVRTEAAYELTHSRFAVSSRWPFAGAALGDLRDAFNIPDSSTPEVIYLPPNQHYSVVDGYLIPNYTLAEPKPQDLRGGTTQSSLAYRTESLVVARATSLVLNAQPEIGVVRNLEEILQEIELFKHMPESTPNQCKAKIPQAKLLFGVIAKRLEMLGRAMTQRSILGTSLEYEQFKDKTLSDEDIEFLEKERRFLFDQLSEVDMIPYLHFVLFSDRSIDSDGALIDLFREIGKSSMIQEKDTETFVRDGIVNKIGSTIRSIDTMGQKTVSLLKTEPTKSLLADSLRDYISTQGKAYGINSAEDVVTMIERYTALCRARACVRSRNDLAYDDIYAEKEALNNMLRGPNGILLSMRKHGRQFSNVAAQELRDILSQSLRIMERAAYTRIPCDEYAPEVWIPDFSPNATPMQRYLLDQLMPQSEQQYAKQAINDIKIKGLNEDDENAALRRALCSSGQLTARIERFRTELEYDVMASHVQRPAATKFSERQRVLRFFPNTLGSHSSGGMEL